MNPAGYDKYCVPLATASTPGAQTTDSQAYTKRGFPRLPVQATNAYNAQGCLLVRHSSWHVRMFGGLDHDRGIVGGAIAGFLANMVVGGREGLIGTIILGIFGAVVGGYIAETVFHKGDVTGVNIESIVIAVRGAILVLFVWRAFTRNRASM